MGNADARDGQLDTKVLLREYAADGPPPAGPAEMTYTIFEGTSEIQRLVIARNISGVHIK